MVHLVLNNPHTSSDPGHEAQLFRRNEGRHVQALAGHSMGATVNIMDHSPTLCGHTVLYRNYIVGPTRVFV